MNKKFILLVTFLCMLEISVKAQETKTETLPKRNMSTELLTDMIDTSTVMGKRMLSVATRFGNISFSGYIQPQFQWIQEKGAASHNGGDFAPNSNSRFRMRRGRIRVDHTGYSSSGKPLTYFVVQFDGTERGMNIRDCWGRYYENEWELFHFSSGIMARPFGFELLYSSMNRETPERGRMSQILMGTERDLGAMVSFAPRKKNSKFKWLGLDAGVYNGQGLTGTQEFDGYKDIVTKLSFRKITFPNSHILFSAGLSYLHGGLVSQNNTYYHYTNDNMQLDSAAANNGKVMPRRYYGIDAQLQIPNKNGVTEFRAEYITGLQSATLGSSITPGTYPTLSNGTPGPLTVRNFSGAYFYFLQHLGSTKHQLVVKYDWYDPNTKVAGKDIGTKMNLTAADMKYNTLGIGYVYYGSPNFKLTFWYEHPMNESTALNGYQEDLKDDNFTCRAQFSF